MCKYAFEHVLRSLEELHSLSILANNRGQIEVMFLLQAPFTRVEHESPPVLLPLLGEAELASGAKRPTPRTCTREDAGKTLRTEATSSPLDTVPLCVGLGPSTHRFDGKDQEGLQDRCWLLSF